MEFSRLERAVIEVVLSQPVDGMEEVRAQFTAASVVKRDYTGVGFFTEIFVPPSASRMPDSKKLHNALSDGAGGYPESDPEGWVFFILWTRDGYISCLEGCTVRDSWPSEDEIKCIVVPEKRRD